MGGCQWIRRVHGARMGVCTSSRSAEPRVAVPARWLTTFPIEMQHALATTFPKAGPNHLAAEEAPRVV